MDYEQTIDFLFKRTAMFQKQGNGAYKPGLNTTLALARAWNDPQLKLTTIHVGGTNGKGSTAHTIAAILQSAGYRVGLYTSPHLLDFRERIRVDGEMIDRGFVVSFVADFLNNPELRVLEPSFFELVTIMAFAWFVKCKVDVAVIEVGLGGRLDSTNIITPVLSVITNISLDHTALLGDSEEAIAIEKAGIIKKEVPVVVGEAEGVVREVFVRKAEELASSITIACEHLLYDSCVCKDGVIEYSGTPWGTLAGELTGECQPRNANTILAALEHLKSNFNINAAAVAKGFANVCELTGLMGRWMEVASTPVRVICDTGHNIGGWQYLGKSLASIAATATLHMVIGFVNDKDIAHILKYMPCRARYYFVSPGVERGRSATSTAEYCVSAGLRGQCCGTVENGYLAARKAAAYGDVIFIGGSTFVVADFLKIPHDRR